MNALLCGGIRPHHDFLYQSGYQVTWLLNRNQLTPEDPSSSAQRLIVYAADDPITLLVEQVRQLHRELNFQRVFAFHDDAQELAVQVAQAIGLDFPISLAAVQNTRNKVAARRMLEAVGVPSCWFREASNRQALLEMLQQCALSKVIIKPIDGTGSRGVVALEHPADVTEAWLDRHILAYPVMIEEFLSGKEFSVESYSVNGHHHVLGITEKFIDGTSFIEVGHVFPAELAASEITAITDYITQVLTATGIKHTVAHTEIMLTERGPRLIETHTRVGGDYIPTLVEHVTGINLYEIGAQLQQNPVGTDFAERYRVPSYDGYCGILYRLPESPGSLVKQVQGVELARAQTGVLEARALRKPGERIRSLGESMPRTAYVIAKCQSRRELLEVLTAAIGNIRYEYQ